MSNNLTNLSNLRTFFASLAISRSNHTPFRIIYKFVTRSLHEYTISTRQTSNLITNLRQLSKISRHELEALQKRGPSLFYQKKKKKTNHVTRISASPSLSSTTIEIHPSRSNTSLSPSQNEADAFLFIFTFQQIGNVTVFV